MNEHIAALLIAVAMDGHISRPSLYQDGMVYYQSSSLQVIYILWLLDAF